MKRFPLLLALSLFVVRTGAGQVVTPFYDRAVFDLAAGATTTIDFEGILASNESSHIFPGGFTVSGVNFVDINPSFIGQTQTSFIEVADGMNLGAAGTDVVYSLNDNSDTVFTTRITLPLDGVLAFGTDIKFNDSTWSGSFTVQLFSESGPLGPPVVTDPFTPVTFNQFGFIGFTSDTPITAVEIGLVTPVVSGPDGNVVLDNTSFGAPVPEPATYLSLILGVGLLLLATRKRRA
jgi:hypothetical protein